MSRSFVSLDCLCGIRINFDEASRTPARGVPTFYPSNIPKHVLYWLLLSNTGLFKAYVHPDSIIVNRTCFELASRGKLSDLVFCVRSFEEHVLKGPFR